MISVYFCISSERRVITERENVMTQSVPDPSPSLEEVTSAPDRPSLNAQRGLLSVSHWNQSPKRPKGQRRSHIHQPAPPDGPIIPERRKADTAERVHWGHSLTLVCECWPRPLHPEERWVFSG